MKAGKIIFWTLLIGAVGAGSVLAYRKFFAIKDAQKNADDLSAAAKKDPSLAKEAKDAQITAQASKSAPAGFPLKRGSNNILVKKFQQGLIDTYGKASTLPRYGADGIFGAETENALLSHNLPSTVSESLYNKIVSPQSAPKGIPYRDAEFATIQPGAYQVGSQGVTIKV